MYRKYQGASVHCSVHLCQNACGRETWNDLICVLSVVIVILLSLPFSICFLFEHGNPGNLEEEKICKCRANPSKPMHWFGISTCCGKGHSKPHQYFAKVVRMLGEGPKAGRYKLIMILGIVSECEFLSISCDFKDEAENPKQPSNTVDNTNTI